MVAITHENSSITMPELVEKEIVTIETPKKVTFNLSKLDKLSLDDLALQYNQIDQQAQLFKGLILLEARSRFKSNPAFGQWVASIPSLCGDGNQVRNRYMNFARYFKDKDYTGISLTCAYEISAPSNTAVADKVYKKALGQNLSVETVKDLIKQAKEEIAPIVENEVTKQESVLDVLTDEDIKTYTDTVLTEFSTLSNKNIMLILQNCIKVIREKNKQAKAKAEDKSPASEDTGESF
jgi:hypothetical protein